MNKKIVIAFLLLIIMISGLVGCGWTNNAEVNTSLNIADFYGEYKFDKVAYMRKSPLVSEKQHTDDLKVVTETFEDVEFSIKESYFSETSGTFGENPSEGFEFLTINDYGEKYYDDLVRDGLKDFEGFSSIFDYDDIKRELNADEINHYMMYEEDGVLSNPMFYITKDNIFIAMETVSMEETKNVLKGYTHYLLKLKRL